MSDEKKTIQIYPSCYKLHTAYKSLISSPPKGYKFIGHSENYRISLVNFLKNYRLVKAVYHGFIRIFESTFFFDYLFSKAKEINEADLIFSTGVLYTGRKPWVLDILDNPSCITGYKDDILKRKKIEIEKCLLAENCKKIICSHQTSLDIIKKIFSERIAKKSVVVMTSVNPGRVTRDKSKRDKIKILFVGSINNPQDFYVKGGLEAIKSFEIISASHNAELVIRCRVPSEIREMAKRIKDLTIIENELPKEELEKLYSNSDIFLLPGHHFHLMATLEAMSYGLPIIVLNTYAFRDYIKEGYNGFLVNKSNRISGYFEENYPNNVRSEEFIEEIKKVDDKVVSRLVEKINILIKNPKLRERMGRNGLKLVKTKFSIERRNTELKRIFDEALR